MRCCAKMLRRNHHTIRRSATSPHRANPCCWRHSAGTTVMSIRRARDLRDRHQPATSAGHAMQSTRGREPAGSSAPAACPGVPSTAVPARGTANARHPRRGSWPANRRPPAGCHTSRGCPGLGMARHRDANRRAATCRRRDRDRRRDRRGCHGHRGHLDRGSPRSMFLSKLLYLLELMLMSPPFQEISPQSPPTMPTPMPHMIPPTRAAPGYQYPAGG